MPRKAKQQNLWNNKTQFRFWKDIHRTQIDLLSARGLNLRALWEGDPGTKFSHRLCVPVFHISLFLYRKKKHWNIHNRQSRYKLPFFADRVVMYVIEFFKNEFVRMTFLCIETILKNLVYLSFFVFSFLHSSVCKASKRLFAFCSSSRLIIS